MWSVFWIEFPNIEQTAGATPRYDIITHEDEVIISQDLAADETSDVNHRTGNNNVNIDIAEVFRQNQLLIQQQA